MRGLAVGAAVTALLLTFVLPAFAASGSVNYFNVSGGTCTSTVWTGGTAIDGNPPGLLPNNLGGPPLTAIVGTGSICIQVILTGVSAGTFTVTSPKLTGSLTLNSGNSYSAEAVFTSNFDGTCVTAPLFISPTGTVGNNAGQINHVFVGTGTNSDEVNCGGTPPPVPEFPLGLVGVLAVAMPALLLLRRKALRFA